jgi:hypothetical protein
MINHFRAMFEYTKNVLEMFPDAISMGRYSELNYVDHITSPIKQY